MEMKKLICFALCSLAAIACNNNSDDYNNAWTTLKEAIDSLYANNYDAFIQRVDSQDVAEIGDNTLLLMLKQKYDDGNLADNSTLIIDNFVENQDSTINLEFKITGNNADTVYCSQKMKKVNGMWKIKMK